MVQTFKLIRESDKVDKTVWFEFMEQRENRLKTFYSRP